MPDKNEPKYGWENEDKTNPDRHAPTLDELIAAIDLELQIGRNFDPDNSKQEKAPKEDSSGHQQYIRVFLDDIVLGIQLNSALEIIQLSEITPLPNLPEWILGICNIRGEIISVVDLKKFFQIQATGFKSGNQIVVIRNKALKLGIVVDKIRGLLSVDPSDPGLQESILTEEKISPYISAVFASEDEIVHLLDVEKLLSSDRMDTFRNDHERASISGF